MTPREYIDQEIKSTKINIYHATMRRDDLVIIALIRKLNVLKVLNE